MPQKGRLLINIRGTTRTLTEWCNSDNSHYVRARYRIKQGWCPECAIKQPRWGMCKHRFGGVL